MNWRLCKRAIGVAGLSLLLASCGGQGSILEKATAKPSSTGPVVLSSPKAPAASKTPTPSPQPLFASRPDTRTPLEWATQLVKEVVPADTSYDHAGSVTWQGIGSATRSVSHTDCSGLVNALLSQSFGLKDGDFRRWLSDTRPLAKDYFTAIQDHRGFVSVSSVADLKPGDFIAVRYPNSAPGDDTGHIMLVAAAPAPHAASAPLQPSSQQWDVTVIDSADSGHGPTDTRALSGNASRAGLGRGVLRLYADAAGKVLGYTWSDLKDSEFFGVASRPIALGRLDPSFKLA